MWCWHKWSKWTSHPWGEGRTDIWKQERQCENCGKIQSRYPG